MRWNGKKQRDTLSYSSDCSLMVLALGAIMISGMVWALRFLPSLQIRRLAVGVGGSWCCPSCCCCCCCCPDNEGSFSVLMFSTSDVPQSSSVSHWLLLLLWLMMMVVLVLVELLLSLQLWQQSMAGDMWSCKQLLK
jgi:hypothetical protein